MASTCEQMTEAALEPYLCTILDADSTDIELLHQGLNTMVQVTTDTGATYTVRTPEKLRETAAFNDLNEEYHILETLTDTPVPTPEPVAYDPNPPAFDGPMLITSFIDGATVSLGTDLPPRYRSPSHRRRFAHAYIDTLATIHDLESTEFDAVCDTKSVATQLADADQRLGAATTVTNRTYPRLDRVIDWLQTNEPPTAPTRLVHGDYRPGNILFTGDTPTVAGVIDWETAFLGDPRTELGYVSLLWGDDTDPRPDPSTIPGADETIETYATQGFQPYTTRAGSPDRVTLHDRYTTQTGIRFQHPQYFQVHAAVGLASVWESLDSHDQRHGTTPSRGPLVAYLARLADAIVDRTPAQTGDSHPPRRYLTAGTTTPTATTSERTNRLAATATNRGKSINAVCG